MARHIRNEDACSTVDEAGEHACSRTHGKHSDVLLPHKDGIQPRKTDRNQGPRDCVGGVVVKHDRYEKPFSANTSRHEFLDEACFPFVGTHGQDWSIGEGQPVALLSNDRH